MVAKGATQSTTFVKRLEVPVIRKAFGNVDSKLYNENVVPVQLVVRQKVIIMEYLCSPFIYLT